MSWLIPDLEEDDFTRRLNRIQHRLGNILNIIASLNNCRSVLNSKPHKP